MKIQVHLHKGQARAYDSKARFVGVISGIGAGKTYFGKVWLAREITQNPQGDFLVVSPSYPMLQRIILPQTKDFLDKVFQGEYKISERTYYLPQGNRVFFGSADKPLSLEGVHVSGVWMDEAGQMKREAWDVALRRTSLKKGRVLLTTTPYNLNWLKTDFFDRWERGDSDYDVIQFPSTLNPAFPKDEFERAKNTLPEWKFEMFYMGRFAQPEGLIYKDFDADNLVDAFPIPDGWRKIAGLDWGYNNPTAVLWMAIDNDGNIFIYKEYYKSGKLPSEVALDIQEEAVEKIYCDPSNPAGIEILKRDGLPAIPADNKVKEGIAKVIELIKSKRLKVFKGLVNFMDEIGSYTWVEKLGKFTDEPLKEYDHLMDAMRYAIYSLNKESKASVASDVEPIDYFSGGAF